MTGDESYHGDNDNFRITTELSPGVYYLEVMGGYGYIGPYQLHVEGPDAGTTSDDHGSSAWSASSIAIGSVTQGELEVNDDRDYFRIEIPKQGAYVFYTFGGSSKTQGALYDQQYKYVTGDEFYDGDLDNFRIKTELKPGIYYLEVKGGYHYLGSYQLHVEGPDAGTTSDDHGSSAWSASSIGIGSVTQGELEVSDDRDYFRIEIPKQATYVFYTFGGSSKTQGALYDQRYKYLVGDEFYHGDLDNFRITAELTPGVYYLEVRGGYRYLGAYQLHVEGPGAGTLSDDHGSSPWSATPLPESSTVDGVLEVSGDRDYFCFETSKTAEYKLYTSGSSARTIGKLYNSQYQHVSSDEFHNGQSGNFLIEKELDPGIYYIEVSGSPKYLGGYQIHVDGPTDSISSSHCGGAASDSDPGKIDSAVQPVRYPEPSVQQTAAKRAVVITHGWNSSATTWPATLAKKICTALSQDGNTVDNPVKTDAPTLICSKGVWDIWVVDWSSLAKLPRPPFLAYSNAGSVGRLLSSSTILSSYSHIHLIAHSAGSNLIQNIANRLKESVNPPDVHMTFLDAYDSSGELKDDIHLTYSKTYGDNADWVDNYYDARGALSALPTRPVLRNAYNFDITEPYDPSSHGIIDTVLGTDHHSWPYRFYIRSVNNRDILFGYYFSLESIGDTALMGSRFSGMSVGEICKLGKNDFKHCEKNKKPLLPTINDSVIATIHDSKALEPKSASVSGTAIKSEASTCPTTLVGLSEIGGSCVIITLIPEAAQSAGHSQSRIQPRAPVATSYTPVWIEYEVSVPTSANFLAFDFSFEGDAEGLLSVYVDGVKRDTFDQRVWKQSPGAARAVWLGEKTSNKHVLGFRLDSYSNKPATVSLSNLTFFERKPVDSGGDATESGSANTPTDNNQPTEAVESDTGARAPNGGGGGGSISPLTLLALGFLLLFFPIVAMFKMRHEGSS